MSLYLSPCLVWNGNRLTDNCHKYDLYIIEEEFIINLLLNVRIENLGFPPSTVDKIVKKGKALLNVKRPP